MEISNRGRVIGALAMAVTACIIGLLAAFSPTSPPSSQSLDGSRYLLVFAGDKDGSDSDFLAVIDVDPTSKTPGTPIKTVPIGRQRSMPHHMEYVPPPQGEPVFMNAHSQEVSLIVDVQNPVHPAILKEVEPPASLRFPHDYTRTPDGTRLVGFLRSNGPSPDSAETATPGGHGGIAEFDREGSLLRSVSAAFPGAEKPMRPYAFALLAEADRLVVTSAPMMEKSWADVVQIYRYSDFSLLHTLPLPVGRSKNGVTIEGSEQAGFGPRILDDGSVFLNAYGCAFYHLTKIDTVSPQINMVHVLETPPSTDQRSIRGACGIPVRIGNYWIQPVGKLNAIVVLDISTPNKPEEVFRLQTPKDFHPHWLSKDPLSNRLVLGSEMGSEQGYFILRFDETSGGLSFDQQFSGRNGHSFFSPKRRGYISFSRRSWPHGDTGSAWGHAALFLETPDL